MRFFDCNAMVGPHYAPRMVGSEGERDGGPGVADLLDELDHFGIDAALVHHGLAREYAEMEGNRALNDELSGHDRLHPCWVVTPPHLGRCPPPADLLSEMRGAGVRAVRLLFGGPLSYSERLDLVSHRELLSALEAARVPTFIEWEQSGELAVGHLLELDPLLGGHPELPVIVGAPKVGASALRALLPRLERSFSLRVETSGLHEARALERLAEAGGARCLLFGTRFPWFGGGQGRIALAMSELSAEDKVSVAGANLERLLEGAFA